jgi:hypothetical protein
MEETGVPGENKNISFNSKEYDNKNRCCTRKEILGVDWWFHCGILVHIPTTMDYKTRI